MKTRIANGVVWAIILGSLFSGTDQASTANREIQLAVGSVETSKEDRPEREGLIDATISAIRQHPRVGAVSPATVREYQRTTFSKRKSFDLELAQARDLLSRAKASYERLKIGETIGQAKEAERLFVLNLPGLRSNRDLLDVHLLLAQALIAHNRSEEAKEEFRRALYVKEDLTLSSRAYSPAVVRLFEEVRKDFESRDDSHVEIHATPETANVYVNGRKVGTPPVRMDVTSGEYFLLVEQDGFLPSYQTRNWTRRLEVVRIDLEPDAEQEEWGGRFGVRETEEEQDRTGRFLSNFGRTVGAQYVVLITLQKKMGYRMLGQLFQVTGGEFSPVAILNLEKGIEGYPLAAPDLVETLVGFLASDGTFVEKKGPNLSLRRENMPVAEEAGRQPTIRQAKVENKLWYKRWWIWPMVGAVGVGIFFGAKELGGSGGSQVVIDNGGNF